ncbi:histidine kinase [Sulfuricaulis limicola]|uniref:histidine kinase n=1 Tax=Sulfuricaulis limicola TaxID=1620215 RepID=A0A1B4XHC8_9GAMM|nr:PAS domain-containing sensor histidine kinase [Sulfuricaulis limicola]BAV34202.1 histidine kinase [Sulfuricaulis limicola]
MTTQPESLMPPMARDADSVPVLQQILDHATAVVYVKDRDGRYQFANRLFLDLFRRNASEVIGRTDAEIFPPEITANLHRNDALVFERNAPVEFEEQVPQQDGTHTYLSLKFPLYNSRNETYAVCGISTDITERKTAEEALRASEERYHTTFNASVDGLALCTPDGRIMDANPAFCRLHGYTREELLAAESFQFVHPDSHLRCWAFFEAASAGHSLKSEARAKRKDGTIFDAEAHGVPVHYGDEPHLLLIMRDISERKQAEAERIRLEAQLRQAQKMEAIGHLTGGVAHDFNNILTAVMGYVAMAQERVAAQGDEKLDKYLERALRSGRQARDLIQQMLTFSRGQRGEPRALQLPPLVKESVKLMRSTLPSSIEFNTSLDATLPAVLLDPVQLEQVLMNLCINARDAMQGAGQLHIALEKIAHRDGVCTSCHQPVRGDYVELIVRDTGSGIAPEVVERMFEPFFSTKEVGKGSGMGLSTVHGIVHEHGGHILVETRPGTGATFRVLFRPMSQAEGKSGSEATESSTNAAEVRQLNGRVLVVDDEPAVGEFMGELLQSWGLEVVVKPNGADAEALFAENPQHFDLVVTDQTMPRMTGIELAQRLMARRPGLPVILYTGYTERLTDEQTRRSGIRALVTKPVDIGAFFGLVRDILKPR